MSTRLDIPITKPDRLVHALVGAAAALKWLISDPHGPSKRPPAAGSARRRPHVPALARRPGPPHPGLPAVALPDAPAEPSRPSLEMTRLAGGRNPMGVDDTAEAPRAGW